MMFSVESKFGEDLVSIQAYKAQYQKHKIPRCCCHRTCQDKKHRRQSEKDVEFVLGRHVQFRFR